VYRGSQGTIQLCLKHLPTAIGIDESACSKASTQSARRPSANQSEPGSKAWYRAVTRPLAPRRQASPLGPAEAESGQQASAGHQAGTGKVSGLSDQQLVAPQQGNNSRAKASARGGGGPSGGASAARTEGAGQSDVQVSA